MELLEESGAQVQNDQTLPTDTPETTVEATAVDASEVEVSEPEPQNTAYAPLTKEEVLTRLVEIAKAEEAEIDNDEIGRLKRDFYSTLHQEQKEALAQFTANGGDAADFVAPEDPAEETLKSLLATIKDKKAALREQLLATLARNAERKREIIADIEAKAADTDNVNRHYQAVKDLQAEFKAIGEVAQEEATALWKNFTTAVEHFYDQWKVNKELRDYDFKKNLAEKQLLLDEAESLGAEEDVIVAFRRLQDLHQKWREIGPVAKELRDEIWNKFKDASAEINKKYQAFFEDRKARERANEEAKTAICERVEAIDYSGAKTFAEWNDITRQIMEAQADWKKLGFASRKMNNALFARFRETCDKFFAAKAEYFKGVKDTLATNLEQKIALCEKAEALKDSTDWRATTDEILRLKEQWRTIGAVSKKQSDAVWRRFMDACDYFFNQKKKATSSTRKTENANLRVKKDIVEQLTALNAPDCTTPRAEAIAKIQELRSLWQSTGHVPFREKDTLHDTYRTVVGELFDKYDIRENRARMESFQNSVQSTTDEHKLLRERERLMRALESRRSELKTYENNLGFFNSKSKTGEQMLRDMERKMQRIKDDIVQLEQKINIIDTKAAE